MWAMSDEEPPINGGWYQHNAERKAKGLAAETLDKDSPDHIQILMSRSSSEINILNLVLQQLELAVKKALMPPEPRDEVGIQIRTHK